MTNTKEEQKSSVIFFRTEVNRDWRKGEHSVRALLLLWLVNNSGNFVEVKQLRYDIVIFINEYDKRPKPKFFANRNITEPYIVIPGGSYAVINGLPGILRKAKAIKAIMEKNYAKECEEPFEP
jgi:hypothetical protein